MLFMLYAAMQEEVEPKQVDILCDVCTIIVQGVEDYVEDPTNVEAVEQFLQQVCDILPFDMFGWCESIIEKYYQKLVDYIVQGYPAEKVCELISLCDA